MGWLITAVIFCPSTGKTTHVEDWHRIQATALYEKEVLIGYKNFEWQSEFPEIDDGCLTFDVKIRGE
jgi:hypothetical protein